VSLELKFQLKEKAVKKPQQKRMKKGAKERLPKHRQLIQTIF